MRAHVRVKACVKPTKSKRINQNDSYISQIQPG